MGVIFLLFVFQDGLRWETGTDWYFYHDYFMTFIESGYRAPVEIGYTFFNYLVSLFANNYTIFLLVHAIFIYSLYLKSIYDYTNYPITTSLCFYLLFIGYLGMSRQHLAIALCLFAFRYIASRDFKKFSIVVLIASSFHFSAIFFFIAYFMDRKIKPQYYLLALMAAFVLNPLILYLTKPLMALLGSGLWAVKKIGYFASVRGQDNPIVNVVFGIIKRLLIFFIAYSHRDRLENKIPKIGLMLNMYFLSILMYIIFNNNMQSVVNRGSLYFGNLFEIFLLPCIVFSFKREQRYIILILLFIFLFMIAYNVIRVDIMSPYKGIFINTEYFRIMH